MPLGASGLSMSSWRTVMMTSGCLMALGALPARAYASTVSAQWLHAIGIHLEAREEHLPGQKQFSDDVWLLSPIADQNICQQPKTIMLFGACFFT